MAIREKFELVIDVITGQSTTGGLGKLRTDLSETEGAFGKLKVVGGGAMSFISDNIASFAVAGAGAVAAFAVKAVGDFQEVALGAGQLSSSLGITTEEASRLQEVGGDLGINIGVLEKGIGRMNRELENSPEKFAAVGAEIARNKDGTVDVTQTFLNVVEAINKIPDAGQRAVAAQSLLGRGWQDMSRLIALGSDGVADALARVESAKVVTPAQVASAEKLRDGLDQLKGYGESASLSLGSQLVPAVNDTIDAFDGLAEVIAPVIGLIEDLGNSSNPIESTLGGAARRIVEPWRNVTDALDAAKVIIGGTSDEITGKLDPAVTAAGNAAGDATDETDALTAVILAMGIQAATANTKVFTLGDSTKRLADRTKELDDRWSDMKDELSDQQAFLDIQGQFDDVKQKGQDAWYAVGSGAEDAEQKSRDYQGALIDLKGKVIDFAAAANDIPKETVTRINAIIDQGDIATAESQLTILSRNRTANISVIARQAPGYVSLTGPQARASGGPVKAGEPYWVGEEGPELVVPGSNGTVIPTDALGGGGGSAAASGVTNITVNVTAPFGTNPDTFARAVGDGIARRTRQNGPGR